MKKMFWVVATLIAVLFSDSKVSAQCSAGCAGLAQGRTPVRTVTRTVVVAPVVVAKHVAWRVFHPFGGRFAVAPVAVAQPMPATSSCPGGKCPLPSKK